MKALFDDSKKEVQKLQDGILKKEKALEDAMQKILDDEGLV
tara:strand:+ start:211 stop:333 length:123 start_codon:yes stop_codon:yes gene_type:complete